MPQPGTSGMEPAFGEAYGGHRGLLSPHPLATSPHRGRAEYDQSILLMLGSPASPRKRPFELLSDLVDDGGLSEELQAERWDVSALDEMARFTRLGLGVGGELLACSEEALLMGRWGRSCQEEEEQQQEEEGRSWRSRRSTPARTQEVQKEGGCTSVATTTEVQSARGGAGEEVLEGCRVEVYQVAAAEEEEEEEEAAAVEPCNEHNYSLSQGGAEPRHTSLREEAQQEQPSGEDIQGKGQLSQDQDMEEEEEQQQQQQQEEEEEEEEEDGAEETVAEVEVSSSSETEGDVGAEPARGRGERPSKRRCFWEYRCARETAPKRKVGGDVRWSLSWSSSTLPSTLYRREGKKGRRKARKTDASDLTPNPQKLHSIGEQLHALNAAIDGLAPVSQLPAGARARSRKEKNKLASRACRLKKKAQHEANKIKLWGLNQEYDHLLGALLQIKELIRRRVENLEEEEEEAEERGMTRRLEDILRESSGPLVAGRTKDFVQRILAASAGGHSHKEPEEAS